MSGVNRESAGGRYERNCNASSPLLWWPGLLDRRDMAMLLPVVAAAAAVLRAGSVGDAPPMLELDYSLLPEAP